MPFPDSSPVSERSHTNVCAKVRVRLPAGVGFALICASIVEPAGAISVDFGASNAGPANFCELGGVAVSGTTLWGPGGEPVAIAGSGLGSTAVGTPDSVDRFMTFPAGNFNPSVDLREGLQLTVDGRINSITIAPHFSVIGQAPPAELSFLVGIYTLSSPPTWININAPNPTEIAYSAMFDTRDYSSVVINLEDGGTPGFNFFGYLGENGTATDVSFQFGFTILSLDYTPTPAPEPSVVALTALGAVWLGLLKRETKKAAEAA
jgi:hypothetical protein